ncbi:DUF3100 domain-containing protein [Taklimakanibacter lacteus]|uniref:DUF3100 domain-containing protein n=1 Tax=Taklimakanibacter lacteus TaxID=2268456 RepID=UPI000E665798
MGSGFSLHLVVLVIAAISAAIGMVSVPIGIGTIIFLPLLYGFILGAVLNPNANKITARYFTDAHVKLAGTMVMIAIVIIGAKFGATVGPQIDKILATGPALMLQEIGNLGTIALAFPVAVFILGMGREAVGATYSIDREPNLALIADRFGLGSPEGAGTLGVYVVGTLLGTIVFALVPPLVHASGVFDIRALAMSCGVGSISMVTVCMTSLAAQVPGQKDLIIALGSASNLLTSATGLYVGALVALPLTEWLYRKCRPRELRHETAGQSSAHTAAVREPMTAMREKQRLGIAASAGPLMISAILGLLASSIMTSTAPWSNAAGVAFLYATSLFGIAIATIIPMNFPAVGWAAILTLLATMPGVPGADFIVSQVKTIDLTALAVPALAYGGLALTRNEFIIARKAGWKIVIVAILVMLGTFLGSAIVAELAFRLGIS